ncbi:GDYXXLXY domain-containing protein [Conservatibacter flavescens]|uniref:DUF2157 domain-containing protein n=1 Tax=Conservatibacter flavescens TaxID=28161 RepID=A0A2M8S0G9_9PAST|nr:GDYXXLXY domain-containing protein [Conservatibacter flavescens]PJG84643.1 hypothetical protein CVP05_10235 [Conservatibacter flavescens]
MQVGSPFNQSWTHYLRVLFVLLGAGLFASGVVTFIAANWEALSKFQKLYATQGLFVAMSVISLFCYWREIQKNQTRFKTDVAVFLATVVIGVLFALIGQIYQTGADPWQLFALWSVLQIPLLLVLRNIGSGLLFIATSNLAVGLYCRFYDIDVLVWGIVIFNALLLCCAEFKFKWLNDTWRVQPKIINTLLVGSLVVAGFIEVEYVLIALIIIGVLFFLYKKYSDDIIVLAIHFVAAVISVNVLIVNNSHDKFVTFLFMSLFTLFFVAMSGWLLKDWYCETYPERKFPTSVNVMLLALIFLGVALLVAFLLMSVGSETGLIVVGSVFLLSGYLGIQNKESKNQYFSEMLIACGLLLCHIYFQVLYLEHYLRVMEHNIIILLTIPLCGFIYYKISASWIRFFTAGLILWTLLDFVGYYRVYTSQLSYAYLLPLIPYIMALAALGVGYYLARSPKNAVRFMPILWALVLFSIVLVVQRYWSAFSLISLYGMERSLLPVESFRQFFNVVTADVFKPQQLTIAWVSHLLLAFSPAVIYLLQYRQTRFNLLHFVVIVLFSVCFVAKVNIIFCLSLLLLAYPLKSNRLFVLAVVVMIVHLTIYYYLLPIPLLYKSGLLVFSGLIFLFVLIFNRKNNAENPKTTEKFTALFDKVVATICAVTLLVLGIANYAIIKNENVLNSGIPIILKLAPVDPRSLMQGDYMELNYEILEQAQAALAEFKQGTYDSEQLTHTHFYILLKQNKEHVAEFCRLEVEPPTDFSNCQPNIYLPLTAVSRWRVEMPGQSYFFPEGQGEHYAKAKYGEYRFNNGKVLLYRLLDEQKKPL